MIDKLNRNIEYLRISVTDRCNLRCVYCMPEEGVENIPHDEILSYDEILRVCKCASKLYSLIARQFILTLTPKSTSLSMAIDTFSK